MDLRELAIMAEDSGALSPTKVSFSEDVPVSSGAQTRRVELTMKYDRNSVQRRLEIEKWIETEMKLLYNCTVGCTSQYCCVISLLSLAVMSTSCL